MEPWKVDFVETINFMGLLGEFRVEFKDGITYVRGVNNWAEGDSNASGKTSLAVHAVCWALYGVTADGSAKYEVINRMKDMCRVSVGIGPLVVTRTMARSGERLEFTHMGMLQTSKADATKDYRLSHVQQSLEEHLGISYKVFCNAVLVCESSKAGRLLEAIPSERAAIVSDLTSLAASKIAAKMISDKTKDVVAELEVVSAKITANEDYRTAVLQDIEDLKQSIEELQSGFNKRKNYIKTEKRRIKREFEEAKSILNKEPSSDMQVLTSQRNSLKSCIEKTSNVLYANREDVKKLSNFTGDSVCPTCRQDVSPKRANKLTSQMKKLQAECNDLTIDLENYKMELQEVEDLMDIIREEHRAKVKAQKDIDKLKGEMILLKDQDYVPESTPVKTMYAEKKDIAKKAKELGKELEAEYEKLKTKIKCLDVAHQIFHSKLRDYMFDEIRDKMSFYTSEYLDNFAGSQYRLEFPYSKKDKFEIQVVKNGVEAPVKTLSKGERWRIKFAIVMAFRAILMEKVTTKYGVLLIDDELGEMDETGFEKFYEMLRTYEQDHLPQVIMTVPRDSLICDADQVLTVTRTGEEVDISY